MTIKQLVILNLVVFGLILSGINLLLWLEPWCASILAAMGVAISYLIIKSQIDNKQTKGIILYTWIVALFVSIANFLSVLLVGVLWLLLSLNVAREWGNLFVLVVSFIFMVRFVAPKIETVAKRILNCMIAFASNFKR